ncbi:hypothetical protein COCVIDRAFT_115980 [Bipolaris victoriae FI3]|uniref:Uncharacterized protein n=1 Tax=Bipolaris victoriae (strain FI3) TaxID=930091 RepID=W7E9B3_BIPV3|nr:hypothetical protein COCVIDRAFT_115980 [Bipolaris victoriae FI3]
MKTIHTRKGGIPALAYATHRVLELPLYTLKILNQDVQFEVILELVLPINSVGNKRLYQLHCGGGNLVPGGNSLTNMDTPLSHELSSSLLRYGESRPGILSLSLKQPCSAWYPNGHSNIDAEFRKLLELARSPVIHILFDTAWLSKENLTLLKCILKGSQEFDSVPVLPEFKVSHKEVDWSIINFMQDATPEAYVPAEDQASVVISSIENAGAEAPRFQDVRYDEPPSYAHVGRHLRSGHGLTPEIPGSKRAREDSNLPPKTKRATLAPSLRAESPASSTATVSVDLFQEAVASAVEKVLSHKLEKELIQMVKKELLPVLDELLRKTPAGQSPSRYLSPAPPCSQIPNALPHHDATPTHRPTLSTMIKEAVTTAVHESLDETFYNAVDQSCNSASIELAELSTTLRGDLEITKEDHMADCNDELNHMVVEAKQRLAEELETYAEEMLLRTEKRLNAIGNRALSKGLLNVSEQARRAKSLPVSNEDRKTIANGS